MWKRQRHGKTCESKVQVKYPSGAYHVPKTVFEELKEEGIIVPEQARCFPYRATFDFECYFDQEKAQELKNTEKLTWQSAHVPLSVSVCSNVPGYEEPQSEDDSRGIDLMASDEQEETEAENEEDLAFIDDGRAMKTTPAFTED